MFLLNCSAHTVPPSRPRSAVLGAFAAFLLLGGLASASTITPTGMDWSRASSIPILANGSVEDAWAGVIFITLESGGQWFYRDTVCIDLFTNIYLGQWYDTVVLRPDQLGDPNILRAAWLVDNAVPPVPLPFSAVPVVNTPEQGAGLQLAIWDIVHDSGDGFAAGRVQASTGIGTPQAVLNWAILYEAASVGHASDLAFVYDNFQLGNHIPAQRLIGPGYYEDYGPEPTPEPPTLALFLGALLIGGAQFTRTLPRWLPKGR
jgi:hypothetical protein